MVFLQFNGETSDGIFDNYNDFIFILYQKNNGCELYKKNDFDFETYSISRWMFEFVLLRQQIILFPLTSFYDI